jgi:hypothetical protein
MAEDTPEKQEQRRRFSDVINRHGHPFQNAVIALAYKMLEHEESVWRPEVMEFPVAIGQGTRIDVVLTDGSSARLIVECKRVNPAFSVWLFAKATKVYGSSHQNFIAEPVAYEEGIFTANGIILDQVLNPVFYHVAHQVKTNENKGDAGGTSDAIEEAAAQVCRGLNGLVNFFQNHHEALKSDPANARLLIPVIITTAKLYVTDIELSDADTFTGTINPDKLKFTATPYLYYQYHLSPGIKHGAPPESEFGNLPSILASEYVRTIVVVNANGIEKFLHEFDPDRHHYRKITD